MCVFNDDVFQFSVGLNGVGTKAVNALSSHFEVTSHREGKYKSATFEKGVLVDEKSGKTKEPNGTLVRFTPDDELFAKSFKFRDKFLIRRMWHYAYLNHGLTLIYNGEKITF